MEKGSGFTSKTKCFLKPSWGITRESKHAGFGIERTFIDPEEITVFELLLWIHTSFRSESSFECLVL